MKMFFDVVNHACKNFKDARITIFSNVNGECNTTSVTPNLYGSVDEVLSDCFDFEGMPTAVELNAANGGRIRVIFDEKDLGVRVRISNYKFPGSNETRSFGYSGFEDALELIDTFMSAPKLTYRVWEEDMPSIADMLRKHYYLINGCKITVAGGTVLDSDDSSVRELLNSLRGGKGIKELVFETRNGFTLKYKVSDSEYTSDPLVNIQESFMRVHITGLGII